MTPKTTKLDIDGPEIQKLVPAGDASADRFATARYSGRTEPADTPDVESGAEGATVSGRVLAAIPAAVNEMSGSFERFTWRILEEAGTGPVSEQDWYAQETVLAVLAALRDTAGEQVVERVGRFLPELLDWPRDVTTVTEAFEAVGDWYRTVHRGDATVTFTPTGTAGGELRLATPYPPEFEAGLVRGLVHRFATDGTQVRTAATEGDGETVYEVTIRTGPAGAA